MARREGQRSQAERSASTRGALLDATVECLIEKGFGATTTIEVTRRAGVSPGAMLHHYPTKADLLTAAVGHVLARRQAEFRKAVADTEMQRDRLDATIDLLWSGFSGPTFTAWVELWIGARTDPELSRAVAAMDDEFTRTSQEIFAELFPAEEYPDAGFLADGMSFAFMVMNGVALRGLVQPVDETPIAILKAVARELVDRRPTDPEEQP